MTLMQNDASPAMNRLRYDPGTYVVDLKQSVGPGHYMLADFATQVHCQACMPADPTLTAGTSAIPKYPSDVIVDTESDLHNLTRKATRWPKGMYRGDGAPPATSVSSAVAVHPEMCKGLCAVDTRLSTPPCTLRGTGWNRWEWLCQDPQDHAICPFNFNVNTGILIKDNHRPHLAKPIDPTLALPPGATAECPAQPMFESTHGIKSSGPDGEPTAFGWRTCKDMHQIQFGCA